jgi:hypothetical protein
MTPRRPTPWLRSPAARVPGRLAARPVIRSVKKTPIDSDVPAFWKVCRMPDAAPRCRLGTLPIIDDVLGAENMPDPTPLSMRSSAKAQYAKLTGKRSSPTKLAPYTSRPEVANPRAPKRSDR